MGRQTQALNNLQALAAMAGNAGFENFDGNGTQGYEVAMYENFLTKQGMDPARARTVAREAVNKPGMANAISNAIRIEGGSNADGAGIRAAIGPAFAPTPGNSITAAKTTILVTRPTAAIAGISLPFAILGAADSEDGYRKVINSSAQLPATVALTSVRFGENAGFPNSLVFTYTQGANVDTVVVTMPTCPYPVFLRDTITDLMEINKIRMKISNSALLAQFDELFTDFQHSPFGPVNTNPVTPSDFQSPEQFQQGIVDIDLLFAKDKEGGFVGSIIASAGFQISFGLFIRKFYRQSAKGWN
jgi:hypothetical protein